MTRVHVGEAGGGRLATADVDGIGTSSADASGAGSDSGFAWEVRDALRHLYDTVHLQTHPLVRLVRPAGGPPAGAPNAGAALRRCLLDAIAALQPSAGPGATPSPPGKTDGGAWRCYRLLDGRYVEGHDVPAVCAALAISRRQYEREHRRALDAVVSLLSARLAAGEGADALPHALAPAPVIPRPAPDLAPALSLAPVPGAASTARATVAGVAPTGRVTVAGGASEAPGRLPRPLTSFVGRLGEVATATRLLRTAKLLTLTGPAGVGKTRLALEVAARLEPDFSDGIVFVPLAAVAEAGLVPAAVACALGILEGGATSPVAGIRDHLRPKRLLLVLDNFEHLLDAAPLVVRLLTACDRLTVLVTSLTPLRLAGEQEYPVPPLPVPPPVANTSGGIEAPPAIEGAVVAEGGVVTVATEGAHSAAPLVDPEGGAGAASAAPAVALFVARARAVSPDFALTPETAPAVAAICRLLDGLPLAIELAAARVRLFSPPDLLTRLESVAGRLPLLAGGPRDAPARHQTLRAALAWSAGLLTAEEQTLLRRLAPFAGGFGLDAVAAVAFPEAAEVSPDAGDSAAPPGASGAQLEGIEGISALVSKSLVRREDGGPGESRFGLLETVRAYALEGLEASGEAGAVRDRHAAFYGALADVPARTFSGRWLDALAREHENLRAAMRWSMARGDAAGAARGLRLAAALARLWVHRGHLTLGREELAWALACPAPQAPNQQYWRERGIVLTKAGHLARRHGDLGAAQTLYEAGLALRRETGQPVMLPFSLAGLGGLALDRGDLDAARACFAEALALRRARQGRHLCASLVDAGRLALEEGDDGCARQAIEEGLALAQGRGVPLMVAAAHDELGRLCWLRGDLPAARAHHEAALAVARDLGDKGRLATSLDHLGRVALAQGDAPEALRRHTGAVRVAWAFGDRLGLACALEGVAAVAATQGLPRRALLLFGAAEALRRAVGAPVPPSLRPWYEGHLALALADLPAASALAARAAGERLPLAHAVAAALAAPPREEEPRSSVRLSA